MRKLLLLIACSLISCSEDDITSVVVKEPDPIDISSSNIVDYYFLDYKSGMRCKLIKRIDLYEERGGYIRESNESIMQEGWYGSLYGSTPEFYFYKDGLVDVKAYYYMDQGSTALYHHTSLVQNTTITLSPTTLITGSIVLNFSNHAITMTYIKFRHYDYPGYIKTIEYYTY